MAVGVVGAPDGKVVEIIFDGDVSGRGGVSRALGLQSVKTQACPEPIALKADVGGRATCFPAIRQRQIVGPFVLTNDSIVKLVKAGFSVEIIVKTIAGQQAKFSISPDDLLALRQAGVPDAVISAMLSKK